jgi:catechol 2,3-dioxygenase-like lactoylglutathione lyase family enzyme
MSGSRARGARAEFGFDHVVIAVRDPPGAMKRYTALGFHVEAGGRHPGFGTANALIQLDNGYIELLAVDDPDMARQAGIRRRELVEYLDQRTGGLIGYALSCDNLGKVRLLGGGAHPRLDAAPLEMSRTRPDGSTLRWRLLVPGGSTWCRPWPFLIEWATRDGPSKAGALIPHPNGASAVESLVVGTTALARVTAFYRENLGIDSQAPHARDGDPRPRWAVDMSGCRIEFVEVPGGSSPGPLLSTLDGEGPVELGIRVASLDAARRLLTGRGVTIRHRGPHRLEVHPDDAVGVRVTITQ